jgi:uncharacterized membrane-anchored protein
MKTLTKALISLNLLALLLYLGWYIHQKETILSEGQLVLLELAPVDPRSLMQGDYMVLNYAISRGLPSGSIQKRGYVVVTLDENGVAVRERLQAGTSPLAEGELLLNYTGNRWQINVGAESYFFEEGSAETFEAAKYGGLRIDNKGNSLLVGLYDEERRLLE